MTKLNKRFDVVAVATDVVMLALEDKELKILLIKPKHPALSGQWALPGGMVNPDESVEESVRRHLSNKAGVKDVYLEQLYAFGEVDRDPFGRVVSIAYSALITDIKKIKLATTESYEGIAWHPVSQLPILAYDHQQIVDYSLERLKAKIGYTNVVKELLPEEFTFNQLMSAYELILNKKLDKRNFSKKVIALKLIKPTKNKSIGGAHRPALLYKFTAKELKIIEIL